MGFYPDSSAPAHIGACVSIHTLYSSVPVHIGACMSIHTLYGSVPVHIGACSSIHTLYGSVPVHIGACVSVHSGLGGGAVCRRSVSLHGCSWQPRACGWEALALSAPG